MVRKTTVGLFVGVAVVMFGWHMWLGMMAMDENVALKERVNSLESQLSRTNKEFVDQHIELMRLKGVEISTPVIASIEVKR